MGAQQSTRKLTLDNDDPSNVIKVSDAVVDRLRGTAGARSQDASTSGIPRSAPPPQVTPLPPSSSAGPPIPQYPQYIYETATTSSIQLRQEKEAALKRNDQYWQKRIHDLEDTHKKISKLMEEEYNEAVKEVNDGFKKPEATTRRPVCVDNKKAVMQCYRKYPNEPMRCASEVQAFADCVDKHRTELVANRGC